MTYSPLDWRISKTVMELVKALCADYPRRKRLIDCKFRTKTTDEDVIKLKEINDNIDAALECVDEGLRSYILYDIANGNGYNKSMASPYIQRNSYYKQKNKAILNIALKFHCVI
mgnify:CR=1 FL=1